MGGAAGKMMGSVCWGGGPLGFSGGWGCELSLPQRLLCPRHAWVVDVWTQCHLSLIHRQPDMFIHPPTSRIFSLDRNLIFLLFFCAQKYSFLNPRTNRCTFSKKNMLWLKMAGFRSIASLSNLYWAGLLIQYHWTLVHGSVLNRTGSKIEMLVDDVYTTPIKLATWPNFISTV